MSWLSAPDSDANKSFRVLSGPATWTCMQSFKNAAHVSVLEVVACQVLLKWICSLPTTFSTSMLSKEWNTPALRSRNRSQNVAAKHVRWTYAIALLCEECILSYVQDNCVPPSLTAACMLTCSALIRDMHFTLLRNVLWVAYTRLESLQIMSFMCCS